MRTRTASGSWRRIVLAVPLLLACAACATPGGGGGGARSSTDFAKVVPGKTTRDEVRSMLGMPTRAHQYRAEAGETWEYNYVGNYERRTFWITYAANGTVASTDDTLDFYAGKYKGW